ncbi:30S ribosomal protein S16 [bacterium]|nr:30S ribosomal protein S16 [bacterium]
MAVHIRLKRGGQKRQPHYRIVVSDSRNARDGKFIEIIGYYNPITEVAEVEFNKERLEYWLSRGAQPTDTIKSLLKKKGVWAAIIASARNLAKADTIEKQVKPKVEKVKAEAPVVEVEPEPVEEVSEEPEIEENQETEEQES